MLMTSISQLTLNRPSIGKSPAGFDRIHVELQPREVGKLIGYDPRSLVMKPRRRTAKGTQPPKDVTPHNVSPQITALQNQVQRSIDTARVATMVEYLKSAMESGTFADWGPIEVVTSTRPDVSAFEAEHVVRMDSDADYFIADGQHRYCAILDFCRANPGYCDRFTQAVTISILPEAKLVEWAGQAFHDRNYFAVAVRAGKALSVDTRDPINALTKALSEHVTVKAAGGIAYERDTLLKGDDRFTTHSVLHRFVKGFLFGRSGLERSSEAFPEPTQAEVANLNDWLDLLGELLPWTAAPDVRDNYVSRTSVVLSALSVIGHELYAAGLPPAEIADRARALGALDWLKTNPEWVGVIGSLNKDGNLVPASSRPAIDSTIRYFRGVVRIAQ